MWKKIWLQILLLLLLSYSVHSQAKFVDTSGVVEIILVPDTISSQTYMPLDSKYIHVTTYFNQSYTELMISHAMFMMLNLECYQYGLPENHFINTVYSLDTVRSELEDTKEFNVINNVLDTMYAKKDTQYYIVSPDFIFKGDIYRNQNEEIVISFWIRAIGLHMEEKPCDQFNYNPPYYCPLKYYRNPDYPFFLIYHIMNSRALTEVEIEERGLSRMDTNHIKVRYCY